MKTVRPDIARGLANAFLAGEWSRPGLLSRAADSLGHGGIWLRELVAHVLTAFPLPPHDARDALARVILDSAPFQQAWMKRSVTPQLRRIYAGVSQMRPHRWPVRKLDTLADVSAWLQVSDSDLQWFADRRGLERDARSVPLQNYRYTWVRKRDGGVRLLEAPKSRLKSLQRKLLHDVLDAVPPHPAAHGFRAGRSALTHARLHAGNEVVLRFDLRAFFADVHPARAHGLFRALGYPEQVAHTLIGLCTNRVPDSVLAAVPEVPTAALRSAAFELKRQLAHHHLPQGAPTSPALANLCAYGLDVRLEALARSLGAVYSRYADDLTFSGDALLGAGPARVQRFVADIVRAEGFTLNPGKTRVMRRSQRQEVTGVVVNEKPNIPRREYDALKATLHNCGRDGPAAHARGNLHFREHLQGRIAWVEQLSPHRGAKLRELFARLSW